MLILGFLVIVNILLFIFIVFLISAVLNFFVKKIPPLGTFSNTINIILTILENKKEGIFVDLGCGTGKVIVAVKKRFPAMEVLGYESWLTQFLLAKMMIFLSGVRVKVFYRDLFRADLSKADVVFCYLFSHLMPTLEKKFEKELKSGTLVISNTFPLPNWKPIQIISLTKIDKIFIYKKE